MAVNLAAYLVEYLAALMAVSKVEYSADEMVVNLAVDLVEKMAV